jgi:hypothetical protein
MAYERLNDAAAQQFHKASADALRLDIATAGSGLIGNLRRPEWQRDFMVATAVVIVMDGLV